MIASNAERLRELYGQLLAMGFVVLRQALDANDVEWAAKEIELLHNVPSLLDEPNLERHRYFWFTERQHYLQWLKSPGRELAKSRMQTYYAPLWREIEPTLLQALGQTSAGDASPLPAALRGEAAVEQGRSSIQALDADSEAARGPQRR